MLVCFLSASVGDRVVVLAFEQYHKRDVSLLFISNVTGCSFDWVVSPFQVNSFYLLGIASYYSSWSPHTFSCKNLLFYLFFETKLNDTAGKL